MKLKISELKNIINQALSEAKSDGAWQRYARGTFRRGIKTAATGGQANTPPYTKKAKMGQSGPVGMP